MPILEYPKLIKEDIKTIIKIENKIQRITPRKMIQLIKILKSGECNLKQAAKILNIGYKTAKRYWRTYKEEGIEGIKNWKDKRKKFMKLSDKELLEIIAEHQPSTLKEAIEVIEKEKNIRYTMSGMYAKFRKLKIKLR